MTDVDGTMVLRILQELQRDVAELRLHTVDIVDEMRRVGRDVVINRRENGRLSHDLDVLTSRLRNHEVRLQKLEGVETPQ